MQVRPIQSKDVDTVVWMGASLAKESLVYKDLKYSHEKSEEFARDAADPDIEEIAGWVIEDNEYLIGFMLAYTSENPFFDGVVTWDGGLYISPTHRGRIGRSVIRIIKEYVTWAEQWNGTINIGLTTDIDTEKTEKLIHKLGFKTTGRILQYVR